MEAPTIPRTISRRKQYVSYEAYLALPDEGRIIEWIDGEVVYHVPPTSYHQIIVILLTKLAGGFIDQLGLGSLHIAPFEVKLWPGGPSREPDVFFVGNDKLGQVGAKRFDGAPDLVVEVISPTSVTLDRITKFHEYERAGVGEYWIIDPRPFQQQADFYVRDESGLFVPAAIDDEGVYHAHVVPGFRLRVGWLWQSPPVNPQRALAWMLADSPALPDELRAAFREMLRLLPGEQAESGSAVI